MNFPLTCDFRDIAIKWIIEEWKRREKHTCSELLGEW
jgi:hypothetical protein